MTKAQPSLLFYDLETSGLQKSFDQVLEFAAIRTDLNLNEIEREQFLVRLTRDCVPQTQAFLTHRLDPSLLENEGITEADAIKKIHTMLNVPGTISGGYNTLGFDDEFLRFGFYRHLLTPYTHQYANGCGRFDLYPMTALYRQFYPDALEHWPTTPTGQPTLKLEAIAQDNGFLQGDAHRAMHDVEATLALAHKLKAHAKMWDYALAQFTKAGERTSIDKLPNWSSGMQESKLALMLDGKLGAAQQYCAPVLSLGTHLYYKNQTLWLRLDQEIQTHIETQESPWIMRHKAAEPQFILPLRNQYLEQLDADTQKTLQSTLKALGDHPQQLKEWADEALNYTHPKLEGLDIDANLYQAGFYSDQETVFARQFHRNSTDEKITLLDSAPTGRILQQAKRYLWRYAESAVDLNSPEHGLDYQGKPHENLENVLNEIEALLRNEASSHADKALLLSVNNWIEASTHSV